MQSKEKVFKDIISIIIGVLLMSASMKLFLVPNRIASGGISGLATILHYLISVNVGLTIAVLNIPLFIFAFKYLGFYFCLKSLFATALFSVTVDMLPLPCISHDLLLSSIFGGAIMGVGEGIILRSGSTTGGSDTAAMLLLKVFRNIKVNWIIFLIDFCVITVAAFAFSPELSLYGLATIYVTSKTNELVLEGPNNYRLIVIFTRKADTISSRILREMQRGVTSLTGTGLYTQKSIDMLLCVVSRESEVQFVKEIVLKEDENAFFIVENVKDVLGEGF